MQTLKKAAEEAVIKGPIERDAKSHLKNAIVQVMKETNPINSELPQVDYVELVAKHITHPEAWEAEDTQTLTETSCDAIQ